MGFPKAETMPHKENLREQACLSTLLLSSCSMKLSSATGATTALAGATARIETVLSSSVHISWKDRKFLSYN